MAYGLLTALCWGTSALLMRWQAGGAVLILASLVLLGVGS